MSALPASELWICWWEVFSKWDRAPLGTWSAMGRNSATDALLGDSRHQIIGGRMVGNCALGSQMAGAMLLGHCGDNRALLG